MNARHLRTPVLAGLLGAVLCLGAAAQGRDTPPEPGPPRPLQIATPGEERLPNGLRVVVAERPGVPLVSVRLLVASGAEQDPPGLAGRAAMTAGLLTRGTTRRSAPALAQAAEALGGTLVSNAGWDDAGVGITVTRPMLARAVSLVAEVVRQPAFAPSEIERYRAQLLDELKVAWSQPGTVAGLAAQRAYFGDSAYGHPSGGTPSSLAALKRADLVRQHRQAWRPQQAVLVFAGGIALPEAVALARRHFGDWQAAAGVPAPERPRLQGLPADGPPLVVDLPGAGQAAVAMVVPAVGAADPGRFAAAVTNAVLGLGYSSRLNQEIRIKRGLSYGARSAPDLRREGGTLRMAVQTKNASAAEVVQLIAAELDALADRPVEAAELQARKAALIGGFGREVETTAGLAGEVGALALAGLPLADLAQRIARLEAVEAAEVQAFARTHFAAPGRRPAIAGVAAEFRDALPDGGRGWRVVPAAGLEAALGAGTASRP